MPLNLKKYLSEARDAIFSVNGITLFLTFFLTFGLVWLGECLEIFSARLHGILRPLGFAVAYGFEQNTPDNIWAITLGNIFFPLVSLAIWWVNYRFVQALLKFPFCDKLILVNDNNHVMDTSSVSSTESIHLITSNMVGATSFELSQPTSYGSSDSFSSTV